MRIVCVLAMLPLGVGSCRVHETSFAETSITGEWIASWPTGLGDLRVVFFIDSPDQRTLAGDCYAEREEYRFNCKLTGELAEDGTITITMERGVAGDFTGVRRGNDRLEGHIYFGFFGPHSEDVVFRKIARGEP